MIVNTFYTKFGVPVTNLLPTIQIWDIDDASNTLVIAHGSLSAIGGGFYKYVFNAYDITRNYVMLIDGGATQPLGERYNISATQEQKVSNTSVAQIVTGVWDEIATTHVALDTTGLLLNQIAADTSATNLNVHTALSLLQTLIKYESNRTRIDKNAMTLTVYDNDGVTAIRVFNLKDDTGAPSVAAVYERAPVVHP